MSLRRSQSRDASVPPIYGKGPCLESKGRRPSLHLSPIDNTQQHPYSLEPWKNVGKNQLERAAGEAGEGGWVIAYGDLISEFDIVELGPTVITGTVAVWVTKQLEDQMRKFSRSLSDVVPEVVSQAIEYLNDRLRRKSPGERDIAGLGVKAGIVTYRRWLETPFGKTKLPNNHQPYIGLRVTKPLLPPGSPPVPTNSAFAQFSLHTGSALEETDRSTFSFATADWNGDGRQDLVVIKKKGTGTGTTEVHVLSGASQFQTFLLHTGTALHETDDT